MFLLRMNFGYISTTQKQSSNGWHGTLWFSKVLEISCSKVFWKNFSSSFLGLSWSNHDWFSWYGWNNSYSTLLFDQLEKIEKMRKVLLWQDSSPAHKSHVANQTIPSFELLEYPTYSPYLALLRVPCLSPTQKV